MFHLKPIKTLFNQTSAPILLFEEKRRHGGRASDFLNDRHQGPKSLPTFENQLRQCLLQEKA